MPVVSALACQTGKLLCAYVALVALCLAGSVSYVLAADGDALGELSSLGVQWESERRDGLTWILKNVTGPGFEARVATVSVSAPPEVRLRGVTVDLSRLARKRSRQAAVQPSTENAPATSQPDDPFGSAPAAPLAVPAWLVDLEVNGLNVMYGRRTLLRDANVRLKDGELSVQSTALKGTATVASPASLSGVGRLDLGWMRARVEADIDGEAQWPVRLRLRQWRFDGPHVGSTTLFLDGLDVDLQRSRGGLSGVARIGDLQVDLNAGCSGPGGCGFEAWLAEAPVSSVLAQVSELLTLSSLPRVRGNLSGEARYSTAEGLQLHAQLRGFDVSGTGVNLQRYTHGRFEYLGWQRDGSPGAYSSGEGTPGWTTLEEVSPYMIAAIKGAEDMRFDHHPGFDVGATLEVVEEVANKGRRWRGGSTITQQLVKNLFLNPLDRSVQRKLDEWLISAELDKTLGKQRVMELYLNVVEWGPGLHGIGPASEYYLAKHPSELSAAEAAWLATALPSPSRFHGAWQRGVPRGEGRVGWILRNMLHLGALSQDEYEAALVEPLPLSASSIDAAVTMPLIEPSAARQ